MTDFERKASNRIVPRDLSVLRRVYRQKVKLILKRIENGRSERAIARQLKISYFTIGAIVDNPERSTSRKVMKKIVQGMSRKKRKILVRPVVGHWHPDAI